MLESGLGFFFRFAGEVRVWGGGGKEGPCVYDNE